MSDTIRPLEKEASGKPRVLVIEDEEQLGRVVRRIIEKLGFEVDLVSDASEAATLFMSASYDAVVSDINLPGGTGVDLLRTIRAYNLDVPVILVTGSPSLETAIEAVELGAFRFLLKPVVTELLQREVTRAVQVHRLARLKRELLREVGRESAEPADLAGLASRFESALANMWIAFQPIVDLKRGKLFGYEALLRSREPSLPGPLDVIAAAERLDRVLELGSRVREKTAAAFERQRDDDLAVFLNLHPSELLDSSLYDSHSRVMRIASRVVLEVTERSNLEKLHDLNARTSVLRFHGYRIAIDDLGAGYAGLTSFVVLEPEFVKLDMSLIRGIDRSKIRQQLVRSVVELCSDLRIQTVSEGVETAGELETLRDLGCHLAQGYLLGRPSESFINADT